MKNKTINKHIRQLDYTEYTSNDKCNKKCIDLKNDRSDCQNIFAYEYSQNKELIKLIAISENIPPKNILLTAGADMALHQLEVYFLVRSEEHTSELQSR